jgi:hypothetical protein
MPRPEVDAQLIRIEELISEIDAQVPTNGYSNVQFRADLAGLLVVAMAATYENCVKEILVSYASNHNPKFGAFAQRNYVKLNSRIRVSDLKGYCELFDPEVCAKFKLSLSNKKKKILEKTNVNIETSYEQILNWRHDFAHAGVRNTTIEEASRTHLFGKRIIYLFDSAFCEG